MSEDAPNSNLLAKAQQRLNHFEVAIEKLLAQMIANLGRGFLSLKNAAFYCDLSEKTLRRLIKQGRLTAYRPARGKVLIKKEELDALIEGSTKSLRKGRGIRR